MSSRNHRNKKTDIPSSIPDKLDVLIEKYLQWMQLKNYTPDTLTSNRERLRYFRAWCLEQGINNACSINKAILEQYQMYLQQCINAQNNQPLSITTRHIYAATVCKFFHWLVKNAIILHDPARDIKLPKLLQSLPHNLPTHEEIEHIINQPDITTPLGIRDRAMLETLYSCGIRACELNRLTIHDVDLDANLIRIWEGKGRKDRIIPLGRRAGMWIEKYLQEVRCIQTIGKSEDRLFLTAYNTPFSRKSFPMHVRKYVKAAQIDKKGACHLFRHAMAIGMLKNGADIRSIQEMLGHSCLTSTQIYTQVSIEKLKEIHTNTHPSQKEVKDAQSKQKL